MDHILHCHSVEPSALRCERLTLTLSILGFSEKVPAGGFRFRPVKRNRRGYLQGYPMPFSAQTPHTEGTPAQ
jgi:hypothetical protein